ncbi:MAG: queuosine precursor transporter [Pseudomonadota bacterium]
MQNTSDATTPETKIAMARQYRYYDLVMVGFVTVFLCSNLIGPAKAAQIELPFIGPFTFGAGVLFFPLSYVFGDILTEVYGYARARKVIWAGFIAMAFAALMATVVVAMPPAPDWPNQAAYETIYGQTLRIVLASMTAYFCGEFVNSFVLAKMKLANDGKRMGWRFVVSTVLGEGVDSMLFYPLAFYGLWGNDLLYKVMAAQWGLKVLVEIVFLPLTVQIVRALKKAESEDYFDRDTNFTPFSLKT